MPRTSESKARKQRLEGPLTHYIKIKQFRFFLKALLTALKDTTSLSYKDLARKTERTRLVTLIKISLNDLRNISKSGTSPIVNNNLTKSYKRFEFAISFHI